MDLSWARYILILVISALVVALLTTRDASRPADGHGWRRIGPGALYGIGTGMGVAITLFLLLLWQSADPQGSHDESQLRMFFCVLVAMAACTLLLLTQCCLLMRAAMRWREDFLVWKDRNGTEHRHDLGDAVGLRKSMTGWIYIVFDDGVEARIDPYASNASALIAFVIALHSEGDDDAEEAADLMP